jgi:hypothetical protein
VFLPGRLLPFAGSGRPGFIPDGYRVTGLPVRGQPFAVAERHEHVLPAV